MKVIHIIPSLTTGGAERLVVDLVTHGTKSQFDFSVLTFTEKGAFAEMVEAAGIPVRLLPKKTKLGIGFLFQLTRWLTWQKPDVVHTHLGGDLWGRIAARWAGVPVVISTEHNLNMDEPFGIRWMKRLSVSSVDAVVALSNAVGEFAKKTYRIPATKLRVIRDGIAVASFETIPSPTFGDTIVFGIIARLEPQKGHQYLFEALSRIRGWDWKLHVIGDGSLRTELGRLAETLGIETKVSFFGFTTAIGERYAAIDCLVLPSLWEGLGLVLMEAQSAGRPVIASRVGGIPEVVTEGETGILVTPGSIDELKAALIRIMENPDQAKEMGQTARAYAKQHFRIDQCVWAYEALYTELSEGKKRKGPSVALNQ